MRRRDLLTGAVKLGAAFSVAAPFVMPRRAQAGATLTVVGWGGSTGDFQKEFWIKPFTAETGIAVNYVNTPDMGRVKAQVTTNQVEWDVMEVVGGQAYSGQKEGLWEPIDYKMIDPAQFVVKAPSFAVPIYIWSKGIAYDPRRTKNPAKDFAQLWDVKNFPGRRILPDLVPALMEAVLLADGVPPSKLYPLDVGRAFKALDRIKLDVKKWVSETQLMISMIQSNEADYSLVVANRVKAANEAGVSIEFSFDQCVSGLDYYAVLKGTKQKEAAMRWIEFICRPKQQASVTNKLSLLGAVKGVDKLMDESARRWVADLNNPKNVFINDEYWADHFVEIDKRLKEWILT